MNKQWIEAAVLATAITLLGSCRESESQHALDQAYTSPAPAEQAPVASQHHGSSN